MGAWGYRAWDNDTAADWFRATLGPADLDARVDEAFERGRPDEIRAACHLLAQLGRIYVWPGDPSALKERVKRGVELLRALRASEPECAAWSDPEALGNILAPKHILPYAKIYRAMSEQEIEQAVDQINELVSRVRSTRQFHELAIGDFIEIAVAPSHDHETAEKWAATRDMQDLVEGPLIETDEIHRAKVKLREKAEQIPEDKPGLIIVPTNENLLFWRFDIRYVIAELAKELRKYPKLLGMVLSIEFTGGGQEGSAAAALEQHVIVSKTGKDLTTEQSVLLRNDACSLPLCDATLERIRNAFVTG